LIRWLKNKIDYQLQEKTLERSRLKMVRWLFHQSSELTPNQNHTAARGLTGSEHERAAVLLLWQIQNQRENQGSQEPAVALTSEQETFVQRKTNPCCG
jgi:hypothetical protein